MGEPKMKFEFSMTSKVNPVADVNISVDCSAEELGIMLSDPAYQKIAEVLITKLQQAQRPTERRQRDQANRSNDCHRNDHQQEFCRRQSAAVQKVLKTINDRMDSKRNGKPGWGELD